MKRLGSDFKRFNAIALSTALVLLSACAEITLTDDPAFSDTGSTVLEPKDTETETTDTETATLTDTGSGTDTGTGTATDQSTDSNTVDTTTGTETPPACDQPGEVLDTEHDLCWEDPPSTDDFGLADATTHCATLELAGALNWRVPTIDELRTIIANCPSQEDGGACGITNDCAFDDICDTGFDTDGICTCGCDFCFDTDTSVTYTSPLLTHIPEFFSSSTLIDGDPTQRWLVRYANAFFLDLANTSERRVRCVRPNPK